MRVVLQLPRYRSGSYGGMVASDHGPWLRADDVCGLLLEALEAEHGA